MNDYETAATETEAQLEVRRLILHYSRTAEPASLRRAKSICLQQIAGSEVPVDPARAAWWAESANLSILTLSSQPAGAWGTIVLDQPFDWLKRVTELDGCPTLAAIADCNLGCGFALRYRLTQLPEDLDDAHDAFARAAHLAAEADADLRPTIEAAVYHNSSACSAEAFEQSGQLEQLETARERAAMCINTLQDGGLRAARFEFLFGPVPGRIYMLVSALGVATGGGQQDRSVTEALARSTFFSNSARIDRQLAVRRRDIAGLSRTRDLLEKWHRRLDEMRGVLPGSPHRLTMIIELALAHRAVAELDARASLTSAIALFESANVDEFTWLPGWSYRVGALADCLRRRFYIDGDDADLHRATIILRIALGQIAEADERLGGSPDPRRASIEFGTARCLMDLYNARRYQADAIRATAKFRDVSQIAMQTSPAEAFDAAVEWGRWASIRLVWREAGEAFGVAQEAAGMLLRRQLLRRNKEERLTQANGLGADAALAFAKCQQGMVAAQAFGMETSDAEIAEMSRAAAQALEVSRAHLMTEALERKAAVSQLMDGNPELRRRYIAAVTRLRLLETADAGVGAVGQQSGGSFSS